MAHIEITPRTCPFYFSEVDIRGQIFESCHSVITFKIQQKYLLHEKQ